MLCQFTIHEVLVTKLRQLKVECYENPLYKKTVTLLDIWEAQKRLGYLFDKYHCLETNREQEEEVTVVFYTKPATYKEQYIEFLMEHNLIFLVEVEDTFSLLNLIFYWLLDDVKKDKKQLDNF